MVKVIKNNNINQCICTRCKSILEYTLDDIKTQNIRINEVKEYIECPVCGYQTEIIIKPRVSIENSSERVCPKVNKETGAYPTLPEFD